MEAQAPRRERRAAEAIPGGFSLDVVGHGTVLAGRYRLEDRVHTDPSGAIWRAVDEILDRQVTVRMLRPGHPFAEQVTEAAMRAALVEDPRLARVLDVGTEFDAVYIITEYFVGDTLSRLVRTKALPAEVVRRLVGEAGEALTLAAGRGLHHLRLTPESLIVRPDGNVKIVGIGVDAAAAGIESNDRASAERAEVIGLVGLLYAGLTGRWPNDLPTGLAAAPVLEGAPVRVRHLAPNAPKDLSQLCDQTLIVGDGGPASPAELILALKPWAPPEPMDPPRTRPQPRVVLPEAPARVPTRSRPGAAGTTASTPVIRTPAGVERPPVPPVAAASVETEALAQPTVQPTVQAPAQAPLPASAPPPAGLGNGGRAAPPVDAGRSPDVLLPWTEGWSTAERRRVEEESGFGPFPLVTPQEAPTRKESRLVLVVVAVVLGLGLVLAVWSLRDLGHTGIGKLFGDDPKFTPTATGSSGTKAPATTGGATGGGQVLDIRRITTLDPQGDGTEKESLAGLAIDGDPGTSWHSDTYRTAEFGGLKQGLGLVLDLGQRESVSSVAVDVAGNGGRVELRDTDDPASSGGSALASGPIEGSPVTLTPSQPAQARYLVVWFTELPATDGEFKLTVSEIKVR
jgi:serine/threonine protein kinase